MRNKAAAIVSMLLIMISPFIAIQSPACAISSGDFEYSLINDGAAAEITTYTGGSSIVEIPAAIEGYSVISIGSFAFYFNSALTEITIPNGVTSIGYAAFYGCSSLTSVSIPASVITIGNGAFYDCVSLSAIELPESLVSIEGYAFYSSNLTSVDIPDGVTSIGNSAFQNCHSLTSVNLPKGLTSIENGLFADCNSLTSITIPESIKSIGEGAFYNCTSLRSVNIPENVTNIGNSAFQGCNGIFTVRLGSGLASIGFAAFYDCTSITTVVIPDGVVALGYGAFYNCTSLTSLTLGNKLAGIGAVTFYNCRSLTSAAIPDSVATIGYGAFYNCTALTSVVIGSGVTDIGESAFEGCQNLSSLTFRSSSPFIASDWIADHNPGLVINYYSGASGFTTPTWEGVQTEMVGSPMAAPQGMAVVPGPGSVTVSWKRLSGTGSEGIDYYILYQDGMDVMHVTSDISVKITGLAEGHSYSYQVAAHSQSGPGWNSSRLSATPAEVPEPISVTITSPAENSLLASENVDLRWTVVDDATTIAFMEIRVDQGQQVKLSANARNYSINGLGDGLHTVNVTAADGQGNLTSQQVTFTVQSVDTTDESNGTTGAPDSSGGITQMIITVACVAAVAVILLTAVLVYRKRKMQG